MNKFYHNNIRYKVIGGLLYTQPGGDTAPIFPVYNSQDLALIRRAESYGAKFHNQ